MAQPIFSATLDAIIAVLGEIPGVTEDDIRECRETWKCCDYGRDRLGMRNYVWSLLVERVEDGIEIGPIIAAMVAGSQQLQTAGAQALPGM